MTLVALGLREEHKLRMSENRVLRKIFGPKRDEVTGEWRKPHNEEFCYLYFSPRRIRTAGHVERMGKVRGAYRVLVGKPVGRRRLDVEGKDIIKNGVSRSKLEVWIELI